MKKYIDTIYKINKPIMILFVLLNLLAIYGLTQIKIETSFDIFKTQDSKYIENLGVLEDNFPSSDQLMVMTEYTDDIRDDILQFEKDMAALDSIKVVKGIENDLPVDIEELSAIKTSGDQQYALITLFPDSTFDFGDLRQIEDYFKEKDIAYYLSGDAYMQNKIFDYLLFILCTIPPVILIILFTIFRIQMGSIKGTLLSVLPAGIAALWTLGMAGLMGNQVSILTVLAPIFTIIIGSADGLHLISHIQEYKNEGSDMKESLKQAMKMVGLPMVITTVTSVAGFVALLFMHTNAIHDLAVFASIGIALAGIITWVMLPTINSFEKIDITRKKEAKGINIPFDKLFGWPSFIIVAAIVVAGVFGIPKIQTEFNQLMLYKDYTEVAKGFEKIMEVNDGTIPIFALVPNGGEPMDEDVAQQVDEYTNDLLDSGYASKVVSFYSILETIKANMPPMANIGMLDIESQDIYKEMVDDNYSKVIIFPRDLSNATIENIVSITDGREGFVLAGTQLTMYELNNKMVEGQKNSLIVAFSLVFIFLLVSLRKFLASVFAMLPIIFTTIFMFAFLGLTGISLNLFTTTLFSITIGVGIDYAIHFASIFVEYKDSGLTSDEAVSKAYSFASRPIIANALGFSLALTALMISPLKVHVYVSTLMWISMILSSTLSLSFLPTLLKKVK